MHLKLETAQPTGCVEIRGIASLMKYQLKENNDIETFVTNSCGKAGIAVAHAAQVLGRKCKVILGEEQWDIEYISDIRSKYNATVTCEGKTDDAEEFAMGMCSRTRGMQYVPTYSQPMMWSGYGEIMKELEDQCETPPDAIVVPVEDGSLLMAVLAGMYQSRWSRTTKIIAAQSERCTVYESARKCSFAAVEKKCVSPDGVVIGDLAINEKVAMLAKNYEDFNPIKSMLVRDEDAMNTATLFGLKEHVMIDPTSAVAIAALIKDKKYFSQFKNIVIMVRGGRRIHFDQEALVEAEKNGLLFDHDGTEVMGNSKLGYDLDDPLNWYDSDTEEM